MAFHPAHALVSAPVPAPAPAAAAAPHGAACCFAAGGVAALIAAAPIVVALAVLAAHATPAQASARAQAVVAQAVSQAAVGTAASAARPPAARTSPASVIADALCGRDIRDARTRALAVALDHRNPAAPPGDWAWTNESITVWRAWMTAGECTKASPAEQARYHTRRDALERLDVLVERGATAADVRARLLAIRIPEYRAAEWPASCAPCVHLRTVAERMVALTNADPAPAAAPPAATVGGRLRQARDGDRLESALCGLRARTAQHAADAQARFAYFTWTRTGGGVLAVVSLLRHASVDALCR